MKTLTLLAATALMTFTAVTSAPAAEGRKAPGRPDMERVAERVDARMDRRDDRRELREERREDREDAREDRKERRDELRDDRRERHEDAKEERQESREDFLKTLKRAENACSDGNKKACEVYKEMRARGDHGNRLEKRGRGEHRERLEKRRHHRDGDKE